MKTYKMLYNYKRKKIKLQKYKMNLLFTCYENSVRTHRINTLVNFNTQFI